MSNIIDKIQLSGVTYDIGGSGGGSPTVELTQAEYNALVTAGTVSADTYYIITDAQAGDLTQYWTSAETQSAITQAVSGKVDSSDVYLKSETSGATEISTALGNKQDTLVSGTNIKTINNESILGSGNITIQGGGKAIEAGRGISITTGETADTVSFNLPISASTGSNSIAEGHSSNVASGGYSHAEGNNTKANGSNSHAEGNYTTASGSTSHAEGYTTKANGSNSHAEGNNTRANGSNSHAEGTSTIANNESEHASGEYNVSNTGESTSAQTLFSVGNGGWDETAQDVVRHNAFEIRKNGDIYLSSGGTDIKLQDYLGGGGSSINVVQTTGSSTTDVMSQAAVTNAIPTVPTSNTAFTNDAQYATSGYVDTKLSISDFNTYSGTVNAALATKQTTLTAGTGISIVDNVISATGGGGGGVTIDPTLDSGSTNPVANSAITEAVLVPSYRGLIEVEDNIAFPNATALYVENVTSGAYTDSAYYQINLSGVSSVVEILLVSSFSGHTFGSELQYVDYEWTSDNSLILTPKESGNYFWRVSKVWETGFGVYIIDDYSSGSSSSVIQNEIYPRITNLTEKVDSFNDTKVTGVTYNNLYSDYGGYWYHEIEIFDNYGGHFATQDQLRYNDFGYDNGVITVKKTSGVTSGSTDCITSGGVYEQMGGMKIVKITESEYAALSVKDPDTLYVVIPDPTNP